MTWDVEFYADFALEYDGLEEDVQDELLAHLHLLEEFGPVLGRPWADTLKGSKHANMKELRFNAADGVWRVAFAFDRRRRAILLVAGDKSGGSEKRFYKELISKADERFDKHLSVTKKGKDLNIMGTTLKDTMKKLPAARRKKVEARANELIAQEMTLRELRQAHRRTQERIAEALNIGQEGVSRLEKRTDLLISTLRSYIEAMGGSLSIIAKFPDHPPVEVAGLTNIDTDREPIHS